MVTSCVELTVPAQERHLKVARAAAEWLTTDKSSVTVEVPVDAPKMIVTTFPIAQRVQFFVLLQIALMGRAFSLHGCDSLAQREANRIYGLAHEFALPKDLTEGDEGFYRGRVYELVRFAEFHLSVAQDCFDQICPERSVATDTVSAVRNFLALMLNACDGDGLEDIYRDRNAAI